MLLPGAAFSASANILMIVSNSASPNASDLAIAAYLTGYGLTIFYADDDDSEATYNSIIAANNIDAVYISTSVGSSAIDDKARNLTVGGVTANGGSWDNMLLHCSGSSTQTDGTDINLVENSHFITQPFSTGNFTAYTGTGSLGWGDNLGSGAQVLAQMPGQPTQGSLVVYETGSLLCGGTPGRHLHG